MKTSTEGRRVLTEREGRKLRAYKDSVGVLTIGVGHTSAAGPPHVTPGMTISEAECDLILSRDLDKFEQAVRNAVRVPLKQHEFDALVSFAFNIGIPGFLRSSVLRLLNQEKRVMAGDAFMLWNKPSAIISRRQGERSQFLGWGYVARVNPTPKSKILSLLDRSESEAMPDQPTLVWYKSQVLWGVLISAVFKLVAIFFPRLGLTDDHSAAVAQIVTLVASFLGDFIAAHGRITATAQPLTLSSKENDHA